jgi:hypothetical protein
MTSIDHLLDFPRYPLRFGHGDHDQGRHVHERYDYLLPPVILDIPSRGTYGRTDAPAPQSGRQSPLAWIPVSWNPNSTRSNARLRSAVPARGAVFQKGHWRRVSGCCSTTALSRSNPNDRGSSPASNRSVNSFSGKSSAFIRAAPVSYGAARNCAKSPAQKECNSAGATRAAGGLAQGSTEKNGELVARKILNSFYSRCILP